MFSSQKTLVKDASTVVRSDQPRVADVLVESVAVVADGERRQRRGRQRPAPGRSFCRRSGSAPVLFQHGSEDCRKYQTSPSEMQHFAFFSLALTQLIQLNIPLTKGILCVLKDIRIGSNASWLAYFLVWEYNVLLKLSFLPFFDTPLCKRSSNFFILIMATNTKYVAVNAKMTSFFILIQGSSAKNIKRTRQLLNAHLRNVQIPQ